MTKQCNKIDEHIAAYLAGELPSEQVKILEEHILVCSECQNELTEHRQIWEQFKDVNPAEAPTSLRPEQLAEIQRLATAAQQAPKKEQKARISMFGIIARCAAVFAILFVIAAALMPALSMSRAKMRRVDVSMRGEEIKELEEIETIEEIVEEDCIVVNNKPNYDYKSRGNNEVIVTLEASDDCDDIDDIDYAVMPDMEASVETDIAEIKARDSGLTLDLDSDSSELFADSDTDGLLDDDDEYDDYGDESDSDDYGDFGDDGGKKLALKGDRTESIGYKEWNSSSKNLSLKEPEITIISGAEAKISSTNTRKFPENWTDSIVTDGEMKIGEDKMKREDLKLDLGVTYRTLKDQPVAKPKPVKKEPAKPKFIAMKSVAQFPFSTFSIDVDTASYALTRKALLTKQNLDNKKVRPEEFVNYFDYNYSAPKQQRFDVDMEVVKSPFTRGRYIMRVGVQAARPAADSKRPTALTVMIDNSGSMAKPDRLGLVQRTLPMLQNNLAPKDRLNLFTNASKPELLVHNAKGKDKRFDKAVQNIQAQGPGNLEAGIVGVFDYALRNYQPGAYNRVLMVSDGVTDLGEHNPELILNQVDEARKQGITLTVVGVGQNPYQDEFLEQLANKGDGNYLFVDSEDEAEKIFVDEFDSNFHVVARDVKIQVKFDPRTVQSYRQIGYENRQLKKEQFRDDKVDAGEVGAGQSVTALYELALTPAGAQALESKTNSRARLADIFLRYKDPDSYKVTEKQFECGEYNYQGDFQQAKLSTKVAVLAGSFAEYLRYGRTQIGISKQDLSKAALKLKQESRDPKVHELWKLIQLSR